MKYFLSIYLAVILLDVCFSASIITFEYAHEAYSIFQNTKIYGIRIPLLLNMNLKQRNDICEDFLQSSAMKTSDVAYLRYDEIPKQNLLVERHIDLKSYFTEKDGNNLQTCPVSVRNVIVDELNDQTTPDLMMECLFLGHTKEKFEIHSLFVASMFLHNTFFWGAINPKGIQITGIADLSPVSVPFHQSELEQYYLDHRLPVENLRKRWPEMVALMETQDPLSVLSIPEEMRLCYSIFETDFYRQKSITYTLRERASDTKYDVQSLAFQTPEIYSGKLVTENITCEGRLDDVVELFYLTRSYNDEDSVFVQRVQNGVLFLDTYIKNIPVLMHLFNRVPAHTSDSQPSSSNLVHQARGYVRKIEI